MSFNGSFNKHYIPVYPPHIKKEGGNKKIKRKNGTNEIQKSQLVLRDFLNYITSEQAIFIGLLSLEAKVIIGKPLKRSSVTRQYLRVISIEFDDGRVIECENEVEAKCIEKKKNDIKNGVSEKTAIRRFKTNKRTESTNILISFLKKMGYNFQSRLTEGKKDTSKLETVYKICKNNIELMDSNQIDQIGEQINKFLFNLVSSVVDPVVISNNEQIKKLLLPVIKKD
ncbi:hypothetical protein EHI8A_002600 [Entamoeba histolytica HM-1:IMSS-B]|uniref:Uncharacterized protein n=6 Tax=Entamoeba histolytica TaxID=5759 RepID=C4LVT8_ENTH1|nr:hypothetical protein EHI_187210 [Entamoeba histolytica HM-1:IMSS]EMD47819.1 Hypothetical protein EHI5A_003130 [Entamoeba histolytica KU27]EMH76907.1 hypothetical protein EHI8A_002600 [Entamoeba histolytica HM-1:IMSS-B]EMS13378.1 hypothetical protein KM1_015290 [Entamoeba histolytica HM-3:IMSS]ENY59931.1 hypothetical protein EHI7A_004360 [Entamoeba histolytica HM-1:IMSS-A]GAT92794.1 hypothetical protein CL6EHI_187210 [Entamoeba histolytica]|eukprot:XP_656465.1 hypothetical protein EHI_187210 [Entamoeba histolytica HM-1:IMSS]